MLIEGCKHELEVTVPASEIAKETDRIIADLQKKVRLPGFRPGKAPASIIRSKFASEVRHDVLESLVPKYFDKRVKEEELNVVGRPSIKDIQFDQGEPLRFKAEFEVAPVIDLTDYRGVPIHYHEPDVSDKDIDERLETIREQKAQYVNIDPRPAQDGDYAVTTLSSVSDIPQPIKEQEMTFMVGDPDKMPEFSEALRGMRPDEEKEFEVVYPEDYTQEGLAGKTVRFRTKLKMLRLKELPELNDEFAKDLGEFETLDQLREAVRKTIFREKEMAAQQKAKEELIEELVRTHEFAVPEAYIERQIDAEAEAEFRQLVSGRPVDMKTIKGSPGWQELSEKIRPKAIRGVRATLLIDRIAEAESMYATNDEVDREVQRIARQQREPVAATRKKLEKSGALSNIAYRIRNEKTLNFLFEHARKEA